MKVNSINYKPTWIKEVTDLSVKFKEHIKTSLYQIDKEKEHMVGGRGSKLFQLKDFQSDILGSWFKQVNTYCHW